MLKPFLVHVAQKFIDASEKENTNKICGRCAIARAMDASDKVKYPIVQYRDIKFSMGDIPCIFQCSDSLELYQRIVSGDDVSEDERLRNGYDYDKVVVKPIVLMFEPFTMLEKTMLNLGEEKQGGMVDIIFPGAFFVFEVPIFYNDGEPLTEYRVDVIIESKIGLEPMDEALYRKGYTIRIDVDAFNMLLDNNQLKREYRYES